MADMSEKYPNYPPYDSQVTIYEGSKVKVSSLLYR